MLIWLLSKRHLFTQKTNMTKKKNKFRNWPRITIQWAVIVYIVILAIVAFFKDSFVADFEAYCPFGGLQAIGSFLLNNSLACTMTSTQMGMGALLLIGVFLFSKLFCAYICPIGTFSEWLGKLGDKLKVRITIKGVLDKVLRSLKYILLFITIYLTFQSNELFCKQYDPFYAILSGYDSDVTALYATLAIAITILGAIFIRLFWCKYLCPLGAISNIFKFGFFFVGVMLVYIAILLFGAELHYAWPLAVACIGGYGIELFGHKSRFFPLTKITRNEESCTSCQLCTIKCPQAIDVASMKVVKDVDCNLCSECITVCPEPDTIQLNKKKNLKWLPAIAIVVLFVLGLFLATFWEVPTINKQWGTPEQMANTATFSREGLKNIKCYGSSAAFARTMEKVNGVYGVATYVGTHKVEIFYDSTIINELDLEESLFTPSKTLLRSLPKGSESVTEVSLFLENFFDNYDFSYLARNLQQETDALAVLSEYACPVIVKIYFPEEAEINEEALKEILEADELTFEAGGKTNTVEMKFEVVGKLKTSSQERGQYISLLFSPYKRMLNDFGNYDSTVVDVLTLPLGGNAKLAKRFPYMTSHLSNNDGIIKVETKLNDDYKQMFEVSFVDTMINSEQVYEMITSDSLSISYTSGKKETVANMFDFER
jgi:ferredoxin